MPPTTLSHFLSALRGRAVDGAGTLYGMLLVRCSRRTLERMRDLGVPLAAWALFARDLAERAP